MNNEKLAKFILLSGCGSIALISFNALSELFHKIRIHSLERKIYKQMISFNDALIDSAKKGSFKHLKIKKG